MYIYEEYAKRTNYNIDHLVRYNSRSFVFLKKDHYNLLSISKICSNNQPCRFFIQESEPSSISRKLNVKYILDLEFEEYENYIIENLKSKKNSICDPDLVFIIGWKTFLIYNDFVLGENISPNLIYPTLDESISNSKKIKNINKFSELLKKEFCSVYYSWKTIEDNIKNYSYWLAKIINS
jgi:hypothetical protein